MESYHNIVKDNALAVVKSSEKLYSTVVKELLRENEKDHIKIALQEILPSAYQKVSQFIYQKIERTKFIESFTLNGIKYYAPAIRLRNTTIAEFSFADSAFYKWRQTNEIIWLNVLVACLYREKASKPLEYDIRRPFLKLAVDARADALSNLNYKTKLAIAYTYEGCRNAIAENYPLIFPKPITDPEIKTPQKQNYVSFGEIILDKIEGDPSKFAPTNAMLTTDFFSIYNKDIKDQRKKKK